MNKTVTRLNLVLSVILVGLILIVLAAIFSPLSRATFFPGPSPLPAPSVPAALQIQTESPTVTPTIAMITKVSVLPTSTATLFATSTVPVKVNFLPPSRNFTITENRTQQGLFLNILGVNNQSYQLGPLEHGGYAVGPNDRYLVYVTDSGQVLAIRFGDPIFKRVKNLAKTFGAALKGTQPIYNFAFYDSGFAITVIITEIIFSQTIPVVLPRSVTY